LDWRFRSDIVLLKDEVNLEKCISRWEILVSASDIFDTDPSSSALSTFIGIDELIEVSVTLGIFGGDAKASSTHCCMWRQ
jgi:hypothetical protein